jgi:hypothetical protein
VPEKEGYYIGLIDNPSPWDGVKACREYLEYIEGAREDCPMRATLLDHARNLVKQAEEYEREEAREG